MYAKSPGWRLLLSALLLGTGCAADPGALPVLRHTPLNGQGEQALPRPPPTEPPQPPLLRRRHHERRWATEVAMLNPAEAVVGLVTAIDSPSAHIQALILDHSYEEAAVKLAEYIALGLVSAEVAQELQEKIDTARKQQAQQQPRPLPPPITPVPDKPQEQERTCAEMYPGMHLCALVGGADGLPEEYCYYGSSQALEAMKVKLGIKNLSKHNPDITRSGPCLGQGEHHNVRINSDRKGSITCCPCCAQTPAGPVKRLKCRIVW